MSTTADPAAPLDVFYSYAREDKSLVRRVIDSLSSLQQRGVINNFFDCELLPGQEWNPVIRERLDRGADNSPLCE